jgi:hypothetical protein
MTEITEEIEVVPEEAPRATKIERGKKRARQEKGYLDGAN